jgi:sugar (pentulose or hexulose) kinase
VLVYAVDVGTTNTKVVLYDGELRRLATASKRADYTRSGDRVEFDPAGLFDAVVGLVGKCANDSGTGPDQEAVIVLTGQAESLVLTDHAGTPVRPALSWMDERATKEAAELADVFDSDQAFAITGEPFPSPTWPAAKLRWLRHHEAATLASTRHVLMVKDELIRRFTGKPMGEATTRGFTYFWDVANGRYWEEMLDFCGVPNGSLPKVVAPGSDLGPVSADVASRLPPALSYRINAGALDHFCAMVGTGSYAVGTMSESAGTVLSLSMLAGDWSFDPARKVSFHSGLRSGDTILFNGADSGGVALEWFRHGSLSGMPYAELEEQLRARSPRDAPIFLPYLTGINPPDYLSNARGAFLGLDLGHDRIDMAYAVEEGIANLLRRNVEYIEPDGVTEIVSTGGGAASTFWNQLKADVCGVDVVVPDEHEATCRGAAILALVAAGELGGMDEAKDLHQPTTRRYQPSHKPDRDARYLLFEDYLHRLYQG